MIQRRHEEHGALRADRRGGERDLAVAKLLAVQPAPCDERRERHGQDGDDEARAEEQALERQMELRQLVAVSRLMSEPGHLSDDGSGEPMSTTRRSAGERRSSRSVHRFRASRRRTIGMQTKETSDAMAWPPKFAMTLTVILAGLGKGSGAGAVAPVVIMPSWAARTSDNLDFRHRKDYLPAPRKEVGLALQNPGLEVPRQHQEVVGFIALASASDTIGMLVPA